MGAVPKVNPVILQRPGLAGHYRIRPGTWSVIGLRKIWLLPVCPRRHPSKAWSKRLCAAAVVIRESLSDLEEADELAGTFESPEPRTQQSWDPK